MSIKECVEKLEGILKFTAPLEPNEKQAISFAIEVLKRVDGDRINNIVETSGNDKDLAQAIVIYLQSGRDG